MPEAPTKQKLTHAWNTAFEPYATAIGFMLREWNDMQERFATLFVTLIDSARGGGISRAVWYAIPNDRLQRKMVCDVATRLFSDPEELLPVAERRQHARVLSAIRWAAVKADELGSQRDSAAHAPLALMLSEPFEFVPREIFGNPLALKLHGKSLMVEFRLYRDRALVLHDYVTALNQFLRNDPPAPFPKKPVWPERPRPMTGAVPNPQAPAK